MSAKYKILFGRQHVAQKCAFLHQKYELFDGNTLRIAECMTVPNHDFALSEQCVSSLISVLFQKSDRSIS